MPGFDRIDVRMALKALKTCHATLYFEYFKTDSAGKPLKSHRPPVHRISWFKTSSSTPAIHGFVSRSMKRRMVAMLPAHCLRI